MDTDRKTLPDWINEGEKFAILGVEIQTAHDLSKIECNPNLYALCNADFELPSHWREWLGALRVEDVEDCTLYLLAKARSETLEVMNEEDHRLRRAIEDWWMGLLLTKNFGTRDSIFLASGSCARGEVTVRQFGPVNNPTPSVVKNWPRISRIDLERAALVARGLATIQDASNPAFWRLLRCLRIYMDTRSESDVLGRIHQFTRCVEGLILPAAGKTKKQFKNRTELFVGPRHHDLMGRIYDVRSDVEHLHENKHLEVFDRATRIELAQLEAVAEWVARECLGRILLDPKLITHFGSVANLTRFWAMDRAQQCGIWGDPIDPLEPLRNFEFKYVSDAALGARK